MRCPICRKPVPPRDQNPAAPFCSSRCQTIDLGNWLGESYRIPVADGEDETSLRPGDDGEEGRYPPDRQGREPGWRN